MSLYGVQLNVNIERVLHTIRIAYSKTNGCLGLRKLHLLLLQFDAKASKEVSGTDFEEALRQIGAMFRKADIQALVMGFPGKAPGSIRYNCFLDKLR
jgi:hypothetical protein